MNGDICIQCKKPMGNSLSCAEIMIDDIWVNANCHSKCKPALSREYPYREHTGSCPVQKASQDKSTIKRLND